MHKFTPFISDYFPLIVFLLIYILKINLGLSFVGDGAIYQATAGMIIAVILTFPILWILNKHIPKKHIIFSVLLLVFGGATIFLNDESYLKIKPTIFYLIMASILLGGLYFKKNFLKTLFEKAFTLKEEAWPVFTKRFAGFFLMSALLNEIVWRNFSTDIWVSYKFIGSIVLMFLFMATQVSFLKKNMIE